MSKRKLTLVAPNSFKGCADSVRISKLIDKHLSSQFTSILKPLSDGGDGFIEVCDFYYGGNHILYEISSPYSENKIDCEVLYNKKLGKIFVESAKILGLKNIPIGNKNPLLVNSRGLGDLLTLLAADVKCKKLEVSEVVIGIGGTATIDFGLGACSRFGLKLYENQDKEIEPLPGNYWKVKSLKFNNFVLPFNLMCVVDVNNQLTGKHGAARVFGQQKGASKSEISILDNGLGNITNLLKYNKLVDIDKVFNGAGGGIASGLEVFLNARIIPAADFIKNLFPDTGFTEFDLVITGEGEFDIQSINQKVTGIMINLFRNKEIPVFLVCGKFDSAASSEIPENVLIIEISKFFKDENQSINNIEEGIRLACGVIIEHIKN